MSALMISALEKAQAALWQYESDLRHPPQGDSVERRLEYANRALEAVEAALAQAESA